MNLKNFSLIIEQIESRSSKLISKVISGSHKFAHEKIFSILAVNRTFSDI
jgi:hypothetical protein